MKKVLMIIGAVVLGIFALAAIIIGIVSLTSKKMKCESSRGDITIMYNDDEITGYAASGLSYDLDSQKSYAKSIGVDAYLDEFEEWFEDNAGGFCER